MRHKYKHGKRGRASVCIHCGTKRRSKGPLKSGWMYMAPGFAAWVATNPPCMAKNATRPAPRSARRAAKECVHVAMHRWSYPIDGVNSEKDYYIAARWCLNCGAVMSLGASNDALEAVQIEMRAAELDAAAREASSYLPLTASVDESHGWQDHAMYNSGAPDHPEWRAEWQAGWLAKAMFVHGEEESPNAWTWDITRPLAEQGEPWLSSHACCDSCAHELPCECTDEPTGHDGGFSRIAEQTRHDVAAAVARHADMAPVKNDSSEGES